MRNKKFLGLTTLLIFLTLSSFISNGVSVSNVNYTFNRNILVDTETTSFDQEFNLRDVSFQQGRYNATFGFLNDTINDIPSNWTVSSIPFDSAGSVKVIDATIGNHRGGLMEIIDDNSASRLDISQSFNEQSGVIFIEFFHRFTDDTKGFGWSMFDEGIRAINFEKADDVYRYFNGGFSTVLNGVNTNEWYHHNIEIDTDTDKFSWFINGTLLADNQNLENAIPHINKFKFSSFTSDSDYTEYIDAVGYSWHTFYNISDNLIPIIETVDYLKEVEKAEFALKSPNTFTTSQDTNYDGFDVIEVSNGRVDSLIDTSDSNDRVLSFFVVDGGDVALINLSVESTGGNFYQTTMEAAVQDFVGSGGGNFEVIYRSFDGTSIGGYKLGMLSETTYEIAFWRGSWSLIASPFNSFDNILIEHFISYELNIQLIDIYVNSTFHTRAIKGLTSNEKFGLQNIEISLAQSAFSGSVIVDSIGVYSGYVSLTKGLGWSVISTGQDWNFRIHNLFTKSIGMSNGLLHMATSEGYYQVDDFPNTFAEVAPFQAYESNQPTFDINTPTFENVYNKIVEPFGHVVENSSFIFTINGSLFSVSEFLIEGVILSERNNDYSLGFSHTNVSINDNYFYVDSNNRLNFIHTTNENDTSEFIQASFNINDFSTNNFSLSFTSQIQNVAKGTFIVDYSSNSDIFNLSIPLASQNPSLTQQKTALSFTFLITDNNNNNLSGITTGFISNIVIIPFTNILDTGLIFSLLIMIIPLIIILIPTIALRELYGSSFVLPIFLLMSFILVLGGLLPIWLMFIIMVSSSLFIIKEKERSSIFE